MASIGQSAVGALMQGYEFGARQTDRTLSRQRMAELMDMRREKHQLSMETGEYAFTRSKGQDALRPIIHALQNGDPVDPQILRQANEVTGGRLLKAWGNVRTPRQRQAAQTLEHLLNPDSEIDLKDPRAIAAANMVLRSELMEGVGEKTTVNGKPITIKRKFVNGFTPSPDGQGVMVDLGVIGVDKDGNEVKYAAPITKKRTAKDDDLVAAIPLDAAMKKVQGLNGMARLLESNPQLQSSMEQLALSYGLEVEPDKAVTFKEVKSGKEIITYAIDEHGKRTEIARAPRWQDKKGSGTTNPLYTRVDAMLARMFASQLDANGNVVFDSQETKDDYLEAVRLADNYIDDGDNPGTAASRAYRAVAQYTVPETVHEQIDQRIDAQLERIEKGGEGYDATRFFGIEFNKTYGGYDRQAAKDELHAAYQAYYKKHGKMPKGFITVPWAEQGGTKDEGGKPPAKRNGLSAVANEAAKQTPQKRYGGRAAQPQQDSSSLARSAVAKASRGEPLSVPEKQAVIEQANQAIAAGKDPQVIRKRLEAMGIHVSSQGGK